MCSTDIHNYTDRQRLVKLSDAEFEHFKGKVVMFPILIVKVLESPIVFVGFVWVVSHQSKTHTILYNPARYILYRSPKRTYIIICYEEKTTTVYLK